MAETRIRLIGRADDAGSCHTANVAIRECVEAGIALNVGVMACCPFFEEAAAMLADRPALCVGLHLTINAEWDTVKWGPVLPPERVPSLVDEDGHFLQNPVLTSQRAAGASPDEVLAEIEAQLARARNAGLHIEYCDEHMGFGWLPGVRERMEAWARREGLVPGHGQGLPALSGKFDDPADQLIARLEAASPGTYLVVTHPGHDTDEMRRLHHAGLAPGQVAREREGDTRMLTAPKVLDYCRSRGVLPIRFTDHG